MQKESEDRVPESRDFQENKAPVAAWEHRWRQVFYISLADACCW